ncbi:MAG: PrgI family protein [Candidatus Staskawiczbacteria bacterium]|nr:PrgI family protein [Candidatus Staskawiczbacteria bacterium]
MPRYQIPQFIEMEAKIVGPFTLKQFGYIAMPFGFGFFLSLFLKITTVIIFTMPVLILGLALAFLKINEIPFPQYLINMVKFSFQNKVYIFKKNKEVFEMFNTKKLEELEGLLKKGTPKVSLDQKAALVQVGQHK